MTGAEVPIPNVDVNSLLHIDMKKWEYPSKLYGTSEPIEFDAYTKRPFLNYHAHFQDFWNMMRGKWDEFGSGTAGKVAGENPIRHTNIIGYVGLGSIPENRKTGTEVYAYDSVKSGIVFVPGTLRFDGYGIELADPNSLILPQALTYHLDSTGMINLKRDIDNGLYDVSYVSYKQKYSDFQFIYHSRGFEYGYIWTICTRSWGRDVYDVYYIHGNVSYTFKPYMCPIDESFPVSLMCDVVHTHTRGNPVQNMHFSSPTEARDYAKELYAHTIGWPYIGHLPFSKHEEPCPVYVLSDVKDTEFFNLVGYNLQKGVYYQDHTSKNLKKFQEVCERKFSSCVAGNAVSSIDAVNSHYGTLSRSDHIETIAELGDILSPIDVGKAMFGILGRRKANLTALLDLLADAKLTYSFALAPTIDDAKEVARNLNKFRRKLLDPHLYGPHTIYGKRSWTLEDDEFAPYQRVLVECRSKIRVRNNIDTLLPYILPPRGVGLLPSFSSAWNLLPYSFVLDWITRTGSSVSLLEDQAILLLLDVEYSTHSVTVYYDFDEDDMEDYSFRSLGKSGSHVGYKSYIRYVKKALPIIGPTILPIIGDVGIPDFGTAGALLYKRV